MSRYFQFVRQIRKSLTVDPHPYRSASEFTRNGQQIVLLVRFFYLFMCFWIQRFSFGLMKVGEREPTVPLWPIELIGPENVLGQGPMLVTIGFPLFFLALLLPGSFLLRFASFLFIFFLAAYRNSFGAIFHSMHFMVYISFALLFLPSSIGKPHTMRRKDILQTISVFWLSQGILLVSYTMAGIHKVLTGKMGLFWSEGLVRTVLNRGIQNAETPILWEKFIVHNNHFTQLMQLGNIYLQVISVFVLFRPSLHRTYGVFLIAFHFGTIVLLHITFPPHVIIWGIFFVFSPFAPKQFSMLGMLRSLPVFRWLVNMVFPDKSASIPDKIQQAWLVYDGECPFCSEYTKLLNIREKVENLALVNAREANPVVDDVKSRGFDLDDGMVFIYGDNYYHGSDALHILSVLSTNEGFFSRIYKAIFSSPFIAKVGYPVLRAGRNASLRVLGVKKIGA